ncbi:MAG: hypothetical protein COA69_13060 [Robiginitomaculum sp.]|nr:MAG: hypothetical protein COA69_13060 [Robiginitomaculum sp.]
MTQKPLDTDVILRTIAETGCLGNSARQYRLLKYLLTEQAEGRGTRIKAYSIALDVLGRGDDFDTSVDSIVRVEMHRLRKNLALFNLGANGFTLIIPKASYLIMVTPALEAGDAPVLGAQLADSTNGIATKHFGRFAVLGFGALFLAFLGAFSLSGFKSDDEKNMAIAHGCSAEVPNLVIIPTVFVGVSKLHEDATLTIDNYLRTALVQYSMVNIVFEPVDCRDQPSPYYALKTEIFSATEQKFISVIVENMELHQIVFSEKIKIDTLGENLPEDIDWTFYKIASKLAHASGAIARDALTRKWAKPANRHDYSCQTLIYKYSALYLPRYDYQDSIACLEQAVAKGSKNANLYGLLATFYFSQARGQASRGQTSRGQASQGQALSDAEHLIEKSRALLKRAEAIDPYNIKVLLARLRLIQLRSDYSQEELKQLVYTIEHQQPYNPHVLRVTALVSAFTIGDWEHARQSAQTALKLDRTKSNQYYYVYLGYALLYSDPKEAYDISLKLYEPNSKTALLMCLASANKAGKVDRAEVYKQDLAALGLEEISDYTDYIGSRDWEAKLNDEVIKWVSAQE